MSDTVQHTTHGALWGILFSLFFVINPWSLISACAFIGMLPDLIGWTGRLFGYEWLWYNWAHGHLGKNYLIYLPPYYMHIWLDRQSHEQDAWWISGTRGFYIEIIGWVITIPLIILSIMEIL